MTEPNTGCARNQGTTQFCAEAVEAMRDRDQAIELLRNSQPHHLLGIKERGKWFETYDRLMAKLKEAT